MARNDTGESSAAIVRQSDRAAWRRVLPAMKDGKHLTRPARVRDYYVDGSGGISATGIRRLVTEGMIELVGVDTYALTERGRNADVS